MKKSVLTVIAAGLLSVGVWGAESNDNAKWMPTQAQIEHAKKTWGSMYFYPSDELKNIFGILLKQPDEKITKEGRFYIERAKFILTYWLLRNWFIRAGSQPSVYTDGPYKGVLPQIREKAVLPIPSSAFNALAFYSVALGLEEDRENNTCFISFDLSIYKDRHENIYAGMTNSEISAWQEMFFRNMLTYNQNAWLTPIIFELCNEELETIKKGDFCRIVPSEKNIQTLLDKAKTNAKIFIKRPPIKSRDEISSAFDEINEWMDTGK